MILNERKAGMGAAVMVWALAAAFLCLAPRASLAQEDSWWALHSLDTRGSYVSAGGSYARWDDFTVSFGGDANYRVEYDDVGQFSATLGSAFVAQLLRFRYELEFFYGEGDLNVRRGAVSQRGTADFYGGALNLFYDSPPFLAGRLTPYLGGGVMLMGVNLDLPPLAAIPGDSSSLIDNFNNEVANALKGDAEFAYGFSFLFGARVEIASLLAIDLGYRYGSVETTDNRGRARFVGEEFHEGRAALILRY